MNRQEKSFYHSPDKNAWQMVSLYTGQYTIDILNSDQRKRKLLIPYNLENNIVFYQIFEDFFSSYTQGYLVFYVGIRQ